MTNNYCVYKHTCPGGEVYYGITGRKPERRWNNGLGYSKQPEFFSLIINYGWGNIKSEVLLEGLSKEEALRIEALLIAEVAKAAPHLIINVTGTFADCEFSKLVRRAVKEDPRILAINPHFIEEFTQIHRDVEAKWQGMVS